ncbi:MULTISPECIES: ABC transporter permease subunit [Halobacterium]|uniref:ABC transporter permease subunit n=1 Tax=Halobacterium TaxID=2239 RepID=UPI00073F16AC|nr:MULTISPECIES: ABC transporter permease subunit [Halobacterium]MCG1004512.1 ABC transporter permease [Halobacterium noricense]
MSWSAIARKDFKDASRSKALWALTALFVVFMAGMAYIYTLIAGTGDATLSSLDYVTFLLGSAAFLIPITALVVTHKAIAGELESGSAKFLLSLPHTRRDAVVGKVVGRGGVLAVSILVGLASALVVILATYDAFDPIVFVIFAVLTLLLGVVYTAIGVGISATTKDSGRTTVLAAGFFILFEVVWGFVPNAIYYLLEGSLTPPVGQAADGSLFLDAPGWYFFVQRLSPSEAFASAVQWFANSSATFLPAFDPVPVYLSGWASLAILFAWLVVAPALGYYRFERMDL